MVLLKIYLLFSYNFKLKATKQLSFNLCVVIKNVVKIFKQ